MIGKCNIAVAVGKANCYIRVCCSYLRWSLPAIESSLVELGRNPQTGSSDMDKTTALLLLKV